MKRKQVKKWYLLSDDEKAEYYNAHYYEAVVKSSAKNCTNSKTE